MTDSLSALFADAKANPSLLDDKPAMQPIPNGTYTMVINRAAAKPYLDGYWKEADMVAAMALDQSLVAGEVVDLEYEIVDGPFKGRKVWDDKQVTILASNQKSFGDFTPDKKLNVCKANLLRLVMIHAKVSEAEVGSMGWACLMNRTVTLGLAQRPAKNGKMYYDVLYRGESTAPKNPIQTVKPVVVSDEEPPF